MKICYLDFWPNFDPNLNWFQQAFKAMFGEVEVVNPESADVILTSSFGSDRFKYKDSKAVKILYIGENERCLPHLEDFADYTLSFDYDDYEGRNFRLPHWMLYVNWWDDKEFYKHARISLTQLNQEYPIPEENRDLFCSIIIGNPVPNRLAVARKLNEYRPVHGYGNVFGEYYNGCKIELLKRYRYNICFENSIYPGYVTEKLFEAKIAGCVPIYYGDIESASRDFNPKCFIPYNKHINSDEVLHRIKYIDDAPCEYLRLISEPLFLEHQKPSLEPFYTFIKGVV